MHGKNPRINVVLERPLYQVIQKKAKRDGLSMSLVVRDMVKEAMELHEDIGLAKFSEEREKTYSKSKSLTHKEIWSS
ncbi:MAG: antitoxin, RHH family protein [Nitrospirae bacterium]|nr:antitoxin, RHH family protein [Nitrospirota bacterium]